MANNKIYMNRKALLSGSKMEAKAQDSDALPFTCHFYGYQF